MVKGGGRVRRRGHDKRSVPRAQAPLRARRSDVACTCIPGQNMSERNNKAASIYTRGPGPIVHGLAAPKPDARLGQRGWHSTASHASLIPQTFLAAAHRVQSCPDRDLPSTVRATWVKRIRIGPRQRARAPASHLHHRASRASLPRSTSPLSGPEQGCDG